MRDVKVLLDRDFAIGRTIPYVLKNAPCAVWVVREPIPEDQP